MAREATASALLFAATLIGGCESTPNVSFTSGTVALTSIEVTPTEGGGAQIDAVLSLELQAFEEPDEVALDSVSFAVVAGGSVLDESEVVVVDVGFEDDDWPAEVTPGTIALRQLRVAARVDQLPQETTDLCRVPLRVGVNVGLLIGAGSIEATGSAEVTLDADADGPRLGLARRGSELPATFDAYSTSVDATVDGEGTTWMLVREAFDEAAHLLSRRSTGELAQRDLTSPVATMAPVADGGVVVVEVEAGKAVISRLRGTGEALWTRELRSMALTMDRGVPVTVGADGVTLAVPGGAEISMEGLPEVPATTPGSFLVDVDLDGTPTSISPVPSAGEYGLAVQALASSGDLLVLATPDELVALREREEAWRVPIFATALTITSDQDIVAATGEALVVRLRGETGVEAWAAPLTSATPATSIAMRANGEALVGSAYASVARIGADGVVLFDGEVVCGGGVGFGGSGGRVAYGVAFQGFEGWGDTPDREVTSPTLSLGEVLP